MVGAIYSREPGFYVAMSRDSDSWVRGVVNREGDGARLALFNELGRRQTETRRRFQGCRSPHGRRILTSDSGHGGGFYPFSLFHASRGLVKRYGFNVDRSIMLLDGPFETDSEAIGAMPRVWDRYLSELSQ